MLKFCIAVTTNFVPFAYSNMPYWMTCTILLVALARKLHYVNCSATTTFRKAVIICRTWFHDVRCISDVQRHLGSQQEPNVT